MNKWLTILTIILICVSLAIIFVACEESEDDDDDDDNDSSGDDDVSDDDSLDDDDSTDDDTVDDDDDDSTEKNFALYFDGVDDSVLLGFGNWVDDSSYTIEAWIKPENPNENTILGSFDDSAGIHNFLIMLWPDGNDIVVRAGHGNSGYNPRVHGTTDLTAPSNYVHVAFSYDNSTGEGAVYVNGIREGLDTFTNPPGNGEQQPISVGADYARSLYYFEGYIDEVRISSSTRYMETTFEPDTRFESDVNTLGLWHFDEGEGAITADASGKHGDATIEGATWVER